MLTKNATKPQEHLSLDQKPIWTDVTAQWSMTNPQSVKAPIQDCVNMSK